MQNYSDLVCHAQKYYTVFWINKGVDQVCWVEIIPECTSFIQFVKTKSVEHDRFSLTGGQKSYKNIL